MRSFAVATLGVLVILGIVGNAQQTAPPTFRAGTTLVDFTIVAVDTHGNPVTDLRPDEISIWEDGGVRPVAFFQFEGSSAATRATAAHPLPLHLLEPPRSCARRSAQPDRDCSRCSRWRRLRRVIT